MLGTILSGGRSSRFYEAIVRQKQLSNGIGAGTNDSRGPGLFQITGDGVAGKDVEGSRRRRSTRRSGARQDRADCRLGDGEGAHRRAPLLS